MCIRVAPGGTTQGVHYQGERYDYSHTNDDYAYVDHGGAGRDLCRGKIGEHQGKQRTEDAQAADNVFANLAAGHSEAALLQRLCATQTHEGSVNHYDHNEVDDSGHLRHYLIGALYGRKHYEQQAEQGDEDTLNQEDGDVGSILVSLLQGAGKIAGLCDGHKAGGGTGDQRAHLADYAEHDEESHDVAQPSEAE